MFSLDALGVVALSLVGADDLGRRSDLTDFTPLDPGGVLAELDDLAQAVADEHNRAPVAPELIDLLGALALEALIADREHLVDQQHVRLNVGGNREAQRTYIPRSSS